MSLGRGKRGGAVMLAATACMVASAAGTAGAGEPFVDTRAMTRHFGQVVPDLIAYDNALGGRATFLFKRDVVSAYEPGWDKVAGAPRPVALMAGLSEAGTAILATRLQAAGDGWGVGAAARNESSHNYRDGAGTRINAGYERESQWLGSRWRTTNGTQVSMAAVRDVFDDGKLLNYTLDADYIEQSGARLAAENTSLTGWFNQAGGVLAWGNAHLDADNFTLRAPGAMLINAVGDHQTWRATGWVAHDEARSRTGFGIEANRQFHTAKRYGREYGPDAITAYWHPGVEVNRASAWGEHAVTLGRTRLEGGLRYDLVSMSAADVHETPQTPFAALYNFSPQALYERTYGGGAKDNDALDHNISARLRAERPVTAEARLFADLSHMVRSPEFGERFTGNSGTSTLGEVGNPELDPERHRKLALGGSATGGGFKSYGQGSPSGSWRVEGSAWHDQVEDFVTTDIAHGQPGILVNNSALIYRNVDVAISGISADAQTVLGEHFGLRLNVTGQRGRNLTDHRALHQMAPLEANLFLDAFGGDEQLGWNAGTRLRAVAAKRAVDADRSVGNGQDVTGPAGAFATLDLYGGLRFGDRVAVSAGVDNVFDKLYREHLKTVPQTSSVAMPNAPGRTLVLRALVSF